MFLYAIVVRRDANHYCTVAICTKFDRAFEIIESNEFDIHEEINEYVLFEPFETDRPYGMGSLPFPGIVWYRWNPDARRYEHTRQATPDAIQTYGFWQ